MKKKIIKSIGTLMMLGSIASPLAVVVSCGKTNNAAADFIADNIVWYYDKSSTSGQQIAEKVKENYEKLQDKAIAAGKMTSKVNVVIREAPDKWTPASNMVKLWGYNDIKSPDIFYAEAKSINRFHTKSGKQLNHLFKDDEYDSFWKMAQFGSNDNKNAKIDYPFNPTVGEVRASLPWFPKSFFMYTNSGQTGNKQTSTYDEDLNKKLAVDTDIYGAKLNPSDPDPVVLSTKSVMENGKKDLRTNPVEADFVDVKNTIGAFNNNWQPTAFMAPILDYIRGGFIDSKHTNGLVKTKGSKTFLNRPLNGRRNSDGYSNTVADWAFIPHAANDQLTKAKNGAVILKSDTQIKRKSLAFGNAKLGTALGTRQDYINQNRKPSDTMTAMYSMFMDPQTALDYQNKGDQTAPARTFQPKIASLGFQSLFDKFRKAGADSNTTGSSPDLIISRSFMGASKIYDNPTQGVDLTKTAADMHKFSSLIAAGIDWPKFLKDNLKTGGGLGKEIDGETPADISARNVLLKDYHVYRMPEMWKMDNGNNGGINMFNGTKSQQVTSLDGVKNNDIPAFDEKASYMKIAAPYDEDSIHFNQRSWEIPNKRKKENKVYALKLFTASLYGVKDIKEDFNPSVDIPSINKSIAKALRENGTFSSKGSLFQSALVKPTNWNLLSNNQKLDTDGMLWVNQEDRLWYETFLAFKHIQRPEEGDPRVDNDAGAWGETYWADKTSYALDAGLVSTYTPAEAAKWTADKIAASMKKNEKQIETWGTPRDKV